jgi:hypothetical protein
MAGEADALALGELALADTDPASALPCLRRAARAWREIGVPYEVARASVLIARACHALDDEDGARLELESARETFGRLHARPDLTHVEWLLDGTADEARRLTPASSRC